MQTSQEENVQPVSDVTVTTDVSTDLSTIVDKLSPTHSSSAEGEQQPQPQAKNPPTPTPQTPPAQRSAPGGRELRRARIVITVKRTDNYKQWLEENPLQAIIAGSTGDSDEDDDEVISWVGDLTLEYTSPKILNIATIFQKNNRIPSSKQWSSFGNISPKHHHYIDHRLDDHRPIHLEAIIYW